VTNEILLSILITFTSHGFVRKAADWRFSSIHRYIKQGILPADWGNSPLALDEGIGQE
jgi:putative transposase